MSSRLFTLVAATVIAWVMALNTGRDLAFNVAYLLTFVLAFSYAWAWSSLRGITLRRVTRTRRSQVGQYAEEQFEVSNRGRITKLWLEVKDESTLPWHEVSRVISNLVHNTSQRWQVRTLCTQRGRFRLGPLSLHSGDPLGIFQVEQRIETTGYMIVYPMVVDLASFEPSVSHLSGGEARHRRTYQITTNVAGVRDYAPGDSLNRIHWPTTARVRRLMAKEFELDPTADVWLYLDLNRMSEAGLPWTPAPPETGLFALHSLRQRRTTFELPPITTECGQRHSQPGALLHHAQSLRGRSEKRYGRNRRMILFRRTAVSASSTDHGSAGCRQRRRRPALCPSHRHRRHSPEPQRHGSRRQRRPERNGIALQHIQRRGVNSIAVVVDGRTFGRERDYASILGELEAAGIASYRVPARRQLGAS